MVNLTSNWQIIVGLLSWQYQLSGGILILHKLTQLIQHHARIGSSSRIIISIIGTIN